MPDVLAAAAEEHRAGGGEGEPCRAKQVPGNSCLSPHLSRLEGENPRHVCTLVEVQTVLPPIMVHRLTMRVVDGGRRLRAAALRRGDGYIETRFVECSAEGASVLAVRLNSGYGMRLSRTDRAAAAPRIMASQSLRSSPLSSGAGEVAKAAGVSPGTLRDVRQRLQQRAQHSDVHQDSTVSRRRGQNEPGSRGRRLKPRAILVALAGEMIPMSALVHEVWGDAPPVSALRNIQTYVLQLRKALAPVTGLHPRVVTNELLVTRPGGYAFSDAAAQFDYRKYKELSRVGQSVLRSGGTAEGISLLSRSLEIWCSAAFRM